MKLLLAVNAAVAALLAPTGFPLVVDPVMIATSGVRLLRPDAMRALQDRLLPLAALACKTLSLSWDQFVAAVASPRVLASYRLTFGASLIAALRLAADLATRTGDR